MLKRAEAGRVRDLAAVRDAAMLDRVFFALSDPVRRAILERLDRETPFVSELAAPFAMSLQAVSRHIHVLVRAGLVRQERTGRISRCSLEVGPVFAAAVWINRYSKYWQGQFDLLAASLEEMANQQSPPRARWPRRQRPLQQHHGAERRRARTARDVVTVKRRR